MWVVKCGNGHFYDAHKYAACPFCQSNIDGEKQNTELKGSSGIITRILINVCRWFVQTVVFSALPLIFYILIHWMFQLQEDPVYQYISELCTITLVISSSVTIELSKKKYCNSAVRDIVFPAHLALLIIFFIGYGVVMTSFKLNLDLQPKVVDNIFLFMILISAIHFFIAALLQIVGEFYES